MESDTIVFDMEEIGLEQLEEVVKALQYQKYTSPKTLIIISPIMTYSGLSSTDTNRLTMTDLNYSLKRASPKYLAYLSLE